MFSAQCVADTTKFIINALYACAQKRGTMYSLFFFLFKAIRLTLCQQKYLENSRSLRQQQEIPRCRPDGKFEKVQCRGVKCYCVDPDNGRVVTDTEINTLFGEPRCGYAGKTEKQEYNI